MVMYQSRRWKVNPKDIDTCLLLNYPGRHVSSQKEKKLNIIPSSTRYANKGNTELSVRDRLQKKREREKKNPRVFTNAEYSGLACACRLRIPLQSGETRVLSWSRSPDETEFKRKQDQTKKKFFFPMWNQDGPSGWCWRRKTLRESHQSVTFFFAGRVGSILGVAWL